MQMQLELSFYQQYQGSIMNGSWDGFLQIQTLKQGYLLKRSTNLRGDWKRRFFVLDSRGMLYYYRKQWGKATVSRLVTQILATTLALAVVCTSGISDFSVLTRL